MEQFIGLAGLPRCGSTLLSCILAQNPKIHSEGTSGLMQLMLDIRYSCNTKTKEYLDANHKQYVKKDIVSSIPSMYYSNTNKPIIVDKCRSWTFPVGFHLLKNYMNINSKVIVLYRPIIEIVSSFVFLAKANGKYDDKFEFSLLTQNSKPLSIYINGTINALKEKREKCLFIDYHSLVDNTTETLKQIYEFCEWEWFDHNLQNIINEYPEDDSIHKIPGLHDVRPTISKRILKVSLKPETIKKCEELQILLDEALK
jgi:sulfotransferase